MPRHRNTTPEQGIRGLLKATVNKSLPGTGRPAIHVHPADPWARGLGAPRAWAAALPRMAAPTGRATEKMVPAFRWRIATTPSSLPPGGGLTVARWGGSLFWS